MPGEALSTGGSILLEDLGVVLHWRPNLGVGGSTFLPNSRGTTFYVRFDVVYVPNVHANGQMKTLQALISHYNDILGYTTTY